MSSVRATTMGRQTADGPESSRLPTPTHGLVYLFRVHAASSKLDMSIVDRPDL